jgi:uncharacterized protein YbjT (DUF2867 family)
MADGATTIGQPVVVLGGTGKTGRRVVERLRARDVPVRSGSRSGTTRFDWEDAATWGPALEGCSAAYITYYPDLAAPGAPEVVGKLIDLALAQGTRRLVLLSGRGEEEAERAEAVLRASAADWTIVRCSWFDQNFSEYFWLDPVREGEVALPSGDVPEPFIDVEDIADVVVAALTQPGHVGELYELTGPRLLTLADAVAEISAALDRPVRFVPVTVDDFAAGLAQAGVPDDVTSLVTYLFTDLMDGRNARVADGVERALGRPARDFTDFARATAASGVWDPVPV